MRYVIGLAIVSSLFCACTKKKTPRPGAFAIGEIPALSNVNTPTISWTASDGATTYDLMIASDKDCQTSEQTIGSLADLDVTVTALADGTHYACVTAVNSSGINYATNNGVEFAIDATPPEAFTITGPTAVSGVKPTLTWSEAKGATSHDIKISKQSDCSSPTITKADIANTELSYTPDDNLDDGVTYYACVTAKDAATNTTTATNDKFSFTAGHWRAIATPSGFAPRTGHSAVWTGDGTSVKNGSMIIFGGMDDNGDSLATGSKYEPSTDKWTAISTTGAPTARYGHAAVWTGSKMIVWGGCTVGGFGGCSTYSANGGIYDPATDSWTALTSSGGPTSRLSPATAWTGRYFIVWGGEGIGGLTVNDGAIYDTQTATWSSMATAAAPSDRVFAASSYGDGKFFVWGGVTEFQYNSSIAYSYLANGGVYDVATNTWSATAATGVNTDNRYNATAVWTGSHFVVWAGVYGLNFANTANGMSYDPDANQWARLNPTGVTDKRTEHTAVWTGSSVLIWGGYNVVNSASVHLATGGTVSPETGIWTDTSSVNAPTARASHTAVWTGDAMLVWGGYGSSNTSFASGALYFP
ncbi:MAG: hypothetical protein FJ146_17560 [Deltaproteobacteria bacterium]|nr:hypothetical protein [Deltaproteobacteria bacterium]